jgi:hypothetical protein
LDVIFEDLQRDAVECGSYGRDLREDVDAVPLVLDHLLQSPHLSFSALQPADERVLLIRPNVAVLRHA